MRALILVDLQNDFCKYGALEVKDGDLVIPIANSLMDKFDLVVATQDWHPANHESFAANHNLWDKPGDIINLHGLEQVLWVTHCVQNTYGAAFVKELNVEKIHKIFPKGMNPQIDSYSGFFDNGKRQSTGLGEYLQTQGIKEVYIMGLATDYCVKFTTLDALDLGFKTYLIEDACRGVNLQPQDSAVAIATMQDKGAILIQFKNI